MGTIHDGTMSHCVRPQSLCAAYEKQKKKSRDNEWQMERIIYVETHCQNDVYYVEYDARHSTLLTFPSLCLCVCVFR